MAEHPNATLMRHAYEAFAHGDMDRLGNLMAENATWHQPGRTSLAGDYTGREGILRYFNKLSELSGGTFRAEPIDILADDERAVAIQHSTAHRDGQSYDTRDVLVCEIRDGKFVDTQVFECDPQLEDSFWS